MTSLPTIYIPHGGGPWPWMDADAFGPKAFHDLATYLEALPLSLPAPPKAILCVTAHWEAAQCTVGTAAKPPMLYDYGGFPPHTYQIQWPAPGAPALAARVGQLLDAAGIPRAEDPARGFDHGTFVPLAVAWPKADIPVLQVSLVRGLDPATHLAIGRALAPLRAEGVLIIGSGMSYHNMRGFGSPQARDESARFDAWLQQTAALPPVARDAALTAWAQAPSARACHPREEHLLPLMVVAGAAGDDVGSVPFSGPVLGTIVSAVQFGGIQESAG
jgi:aromatic ring-opening dioxygenase catalytic subunit (LigB family)